MIEEITAVIIDDNTAVGTAMATEIPIWDSVRKKKFNIGYYRNCLFCIAILKL